MIHPASRRSLEYVAQMLDELVDDIPILGACVEEGVPCLHREVLSLAQEVRNALVEDAESVPYRTNVPPA